jgi:mRNA-degrading endonuclease RelE of RelBE toxin-antitoxin system
MRYRVELKPKAEKDLKTLSGKDRDLVVERLRWLEDDLRGDVKRLTNHFPEYRMRAGVIDPRPLGRLRNPKPLRNERNE